MPPPPAPAPDHSGPVLFLLGLVMVGFLLVVWGVGRAEEQPPLHEPPLQQHDPRDRAPDGGRERDGRGERQRATADPARPWDRNVP